MRKKIQVAIIGTGNIGTDLLLKIQRSRYLKCSAFIGRNLSSTGMLKALSLGIPVSDGGINYLRRNPECCEIVFDATSASAHKLHAPILAKLGKFTIDLTPAKIGQLCVPVVNISSALTSKNVNLITCGGQASIPMAHAIALTHSQVDYIEVISSIASRSAGPATRLNLDEYIHTTEYALKKFSAAKQTKAILNLNPAEPCINMQTTIFARVNNPNIDALALCAKKIESQVQQYVPGYELIVGPMLENNRIVIMVRVRGLGDYLPAYAGNLDIINCAALTLAEQYALSQKAQIQVEESLLL